MSTLTFISAFGENAGKITSRDDRTAIRSHVMRRRWAATTQTFQSSPPRSNQEPPKPQNSVPEVRLVSRKSHRERVALFDPVKNISTTDQEIDHAPDICRCLNKTVDGFIYAGLYIDSHSFRFFQHYSSEFHAIFCTEIQPLSLFTMNMCCLIAVQENSAALKHLICFIGASHEAVVQSSSPQQLIQGIDAPSRAFQDALSYKSNGLALLNAILCQPNGGVSECSILCVLLLLSSDTITGNQIAVTAHRKGLMQMIGLYGGTLALSPMMATLLSLTDIKSATVQDTPPCFPIQPYLLRRLERHSSDEAHLSNIKIPLGSRFFVEPTLSRLSQELLKCLRYTRHMVLITEQLYQNPNVSSIYGLDDFILLDHCLLSLHLPAHGDRLQECVRTSLLLYSNIALWRTPYYFGWVTSLLKKLKYALCALDWQSDSKESLYLILWMLFVGGSISKYSPKEAAWWMSTLKILIVKMDLVHWEQVSDILYSFFYVKRISGSSWERVWEIATSQTAGTSTNNPVESIRHPCSFGA